jgi:hypothetical protein
MRISANDKDKDFTPLAWSVLVQLDGKPVRNCIDADDELGIVTMYHPDKNGQLVMRGKNVVTRRVRGKVSITLSPDAPDWMKSNPLPEMIEKMKFKTNSKVTQ